MSNKLKTKLCFRVNDLNIHGREKSLNASLGYEDEAVATVTITKAH